MTKQWLERHNGFRVKGAPVAAVRYYKHLSSQNENPQPYKQKGVQTVTEVGVGSALRQTCENNLASRLLSTNRWRLNTTTNAPPTIPTTCVSLFSESCGAVTNNDLVWKHGVLAPLRSGLHLALAGRFHRRSPNLSLKSNQEEWVCPSQGK